MSPHPSISIALNSPDQPTILHTSGDKVKGQVRLLLTPYGESGEHLTDLSVHFKGRIKTQVTTGSGEHSTTHYAKAVLFHFWKDLRPNNENTWPFEFEFPWEALPIEQPRPFPPHENFESTPGHQLPPTWDDRRQEVSYYIEVMAYDPKAFFHSNVKNRMEILFSPCRTTYNPVLNLHHSKGLHVRETYKLDPILEVEHRGFKNGLRNLFHNSDPVPKFNFYIRSSIPQQTFVGSVLPIMIGIEADLATSTAPEVPEVYLDSIHVRLTARTEYRTPYRTLFGGEGSHCTHHTEKITILDRSNRMLMYDRMQLDQQIPALKINQNVYPSFRSYNLTRNYVLKVTAKVTCLEKTFEVYLGTRPIVILPGIFRSLETQIENHSMSLQETSVVNEPYEECLPPYQANLPPYQAVDSNRTTEHSASLVVR